MYSPHKERYDQMTYRRCGKSGLRLPAISLGLWHNFGAQDFYENCRSMLHTAFDQGITHFDQANNYGPPPGAAEFTFGKNLKQDLLSYRDELIITSKAGWPMWPGPYGDGGSRKYLMASLEQSLKRLGLEYVDIFYHHRPDPSTPLEESMMALHDMIRQGKALYAGISSYGPEATREAATIMRSLGTPLVLHQPKYSLLERSIEQGLLDVVDREGMGCITFSSLAQGLLTNKYLDGIPADSRAAGNRGNGALEKTGITEPLLEKIRKMNALATRRGESLAQLSLAWVLKDPRITSVIIGASRPEQVKDSLQCLKSNSFDSSALAEIDSILST